MLIRVRPERERLSGADHGSRARGITAHAVWKCGWWGNPPRGFESLSLRIRCNTSTGALSMRTNGSP